MGRIAGILLLVGGLFLLHSPVMAQKMKPEDFCGTRYRDLQALKEQLKYQFEFLRLQDGDTIVDIGAASGWYEGAVWAGTDLKKLQVILVDIDSNCLNQQRVSNMLHHYSALKNAPEELGITMIRNTPDSLYLEPGKYSKVWLLNTLHEVPEPSKLLQQIYRVLRPGGELILLELVPTRPGKKHGGCNKPLLTPEQWVELFQQNGFRKTESMIDAARNKKTPVTMIRFIR